MRKKTEKKLNVFDRNTNKVLRYKNHQKKSALPFSQQLAETIIMQQQKIKSKEEQQRLALAEKIQKKAGKIKSWV